jgi:hypothetical protein
VSVERRRVWLLPMALGALALGNGASATDGAPDTEFLEYLGSWDESDEDWLTVAEWPKRSVDSSDAGKKQDKRQDDEQES